MAMDYQEKRWLDNAKASDQENLQNQKFKEQAALQDLKHRMDQEKEENREQVRRRERMDEHQMRVNEREKQLKADRLERQKDREIRAKDAEEKNLSLIEAARERSKSDRDIAKMNLEAKQGQLAAEQEANFEITAKQLAASLDQMGLSHEQAKEMLGLHFHDYVNRENIVEQSQQFEHARTLERHRLLHELEQAASEEEFDRALFMVAAETLRFKIEEAVRLNAELDMEDCRAEHERERIRLEAQIRAEDEERAHRHLLAQLKAQADADIHRNKETSVDDALIRMWERRETRAEYTQLKQKWEKEHEQMKQKATSGLNQQPTKEK